MKATRAYDNGNEFADRYTVIFDTGDEYNMSSDANWPNGCCIYGGNENDPDYLFPSRGKKIALDALPEGTKKQIDYLASRYDNDFGFHWIV
jgi:hypothetical protein